MKFLSEEYAMRSILVLLTVLSLVAAGGCSISKSIGSISDSISSPLESSSGSGGDDDSDADKPQDEKSYLKDVEQIGVSYAKNGGDVGALRSAVSALAVARGVTNWEVDDATRKAIGAGVAEGGMTSEEFDVFANHLFGDDVGKVGSLRSGYVDAGGGEDEDEDSE